MSDDGNKRKGRKPIPRIELDRRQPIARRGLHQEVADRLRAMIVRSELAPGQRLAEVALCDALGVSRTPLREALKLLSAEGLIDLRPNRGALIAPLDDGEVRDLFETAAGIERLAAELAALRLTARDVAALQRMQDEMERCHELGNQRAYFEINQRVHRFIVAGAKNEVLVATHASLHARMERARYAALEHQGRWEESIAEHRTVLEHLRRREDQAAGRAMQLHVQRTGQVVADILLQHEAAAA